MFTSIVNRILPLLKKIKYLQVIYRRAREIGGYVRFFMGKSNVITTKFVIFAQGRTGSQLLCSLLNSNPRIHCDGEILKHKVFFPKILIKARCAISNRDTYGFNVKIYQLWDQKIGDSRQFMHGLYENGWRIIYLKRRNILRQTISGFVAEHHNVWRHKLTDGPLTLGRIHVDCDELAERMKEREMYLVYEKAVLDDLPHITIVYEDDLLRAQNHQNTLDRIFEYLNVPSVPVKAQYVKITPQRLSEFVQNYEEVVRVIGKMGTLEFLNE